MSVSVLLLPNSRTPETVTRTPWFIYYSFFYAAASVLVEHGGQTVGQLGHQRLLDGGAQAAQRLELYPPTSVSRVSINYPKPAQDRNVREMPLAAVLTNARSSVTAEAGA